MNEYNKSMEERLNELYRTNLSKYQELLLTIKTLGVRVYRNSEGIHKIKYNMDDVMNSVEELRKKRQERNMEAFMKGFLGK